MARRAIVGLFLVLVLSIQEAEAQEGTPGRAYKLAIWYELADPVTSVKTKVYDIAKGEYDEKTVTSWLDNIRANYPHHAAYVRDIQTGGEPGATEADRLASSLLRVSQPWPHLRPHPSSRPIPKLVGPSVGSPGSERRSTGRSSSGRPAPGSSGATSTPAASPIPYPYRSRPL